MSFSNLFIKTLNEALNDCESNDNIERSLNMLCQNQTHYHLSDVNLNTEFQLALIDRSIDNKKNVRENELRIRSKLCNKYMIRDCFQYYLHLLIEIIELCKRKSLPICKIDTIVEILQRENVITPLVRSHWFSANKAGSTDNEIIDGRVFAIKKCMQFLSSMEMEDNPNEAQWSWLNVTLNCCCLYPFVMFINSLIRCYCKYIESIYYYFF